MGSALALEFIKTTGGVPTDQFRFRMDIPILDRLLKPDMGRG